jgi:hypothetical protein
VHNPIPAEQIFHLAQELAINLGAYVDLLDSAQHFDGDAHAGPHDGPDASKDTKTTRLAAEFEMYAYADYARLNEERRELLKDIKERRLIYG